MPRSREVNARIRMERGQAELIGNHPSVWLGIPYDRPVIGFGGKNINTLRLWSAGAPDSFHFHQFSHGDFVGAVTETLELLQEVAEGKDRP